MEGLDADRSKLAGFTSMLQGLAIRRLEWNKWDPSRSNNTIWSFGRRYEQSSPEPGPTHPNIEQTAPTGRSELENSTSGVVVDSARDDAELVDRADATREPWKDFLDYANSLFRLTYRNRFPLIPPSGDPALMSRLTLSTRTSAFLHSGFQSDEGWGCMIRSGQMLLANTILALNQPEFGQLPAKRDMQLEKSIIELFSDHPAAPFSIHNFVESGSKLKIVPGQWFEATPTGKCIQDLISMADRSSVVGGLQVYLATSSNDIYEADVLEKAQSNGSQFSPVLILAPIHLGNRLGTLYKDGLLSVFQMRQSVGIAGGRNRASHYFFATQGDDTLLFMDPHQTQLAIPPRLEQTDPEYEKYVQFLESKSRLYSFSSLVHSTMATLSAFHASFTQSQSPPRPSSSSSAPQTPVGGFSSDRPRSSSQPGRPASLSSTTTPTMTIPPVEDSLESCHSRTPLSMPVDEVDPSMLLGFLIRSLKDWNSWKAQIDSHPHHGFSCRKPMVTILPGSRLEEVEAEGFDEDEDMVRIDVQPGPDQSTKVLSNQDGTIRGFNVVDSTVVDTANGDGGIVLV